MPLDDQEKNICTLSSHRATRELYAKVSSHRALVGAICEGSMRIELRLELYAKGALCGSTQLYAALHLHKSLPSFGIKAFVPGGSLKLDESISNFKGAWCIYFYFISYRNTCMQTVKILITRLVLRCLIWACTVCLCPFLRDTMHKWAK